MTKEYNGATSYRRWLLNECLVKHANIYSDSSVVLDVGGNRQIGAKGYKYPTETVSSWTYLNIDPNTNPDVVADASEIPLSDASVDVVVCTEVLEHLASPSHCIAEILRILKPGGIFIGSAPFVFPVHGDPNDYYRYTESGLRLLLQNFLVVDIEPMGGSLGVVGLLIEQELNNLSKSRITRSFMRRMALAMCQKDYEKKFKGRSRLTTGWFWKCTK